jgi:hypothetical protein
MTTVTIRHYLAAAIVAAVGLITWIVVFSGINEETGSPLSEYLGFDRADLNFASAQETSEQITEAEQERQAAIAECMADYGFDYEPVEPASSAVSPPPGSREYAQVYGFGITTMAYSQAQVGDHLAGYPEPIEAPANPNLARVEALEPGQRSTYVETLTGAPPDSVEPVSADLLHGSTDAGGCQGQATADAAAHQAFYAEFAEDIDHLRQQILADPAVVEHQQRIETCVTDAGIEYTPTHDLHQRWAPTLHQIHDRTIDTQAPGPESDAPTRLLPRLSAQSRAELLTIQNEETELAVTVFDCGGSPAETADILTEVANRHEQAFITDNQTRLEAFKAEHAQPGQ